MNCLNSQTQNLWRRHRQKWLNCQLCPLGANATEHVLGRGQLPAEVLFVGEAPGETEDLTGEPFTGRSGRILEQMLVEIRMETKRDISYAISNVLACRPVDEYGRDRPPTPSEAACCAPRLTEFFAIGKVKALVVMGKSAAKFFPEKSLPRLEITHPAYWLRTGDTHGYNYKKAKIELKKFLLEHVYG